MADKREEPDREVQRSRQSGESGQSEPGSDAAFRLACRRYSHLRSRNPR